ncbi:MAG: hypothetical protein JRI52_06730 [Deltaproteobacteria bacterium]|nr:hypothetical protein [Deltaproteobacteria bacterium]
MRKCSQWNRNNTEYFKANYLQKKLEAASVPAHPEKAPHPKSRFKSGLPLEVVQDVISIQHIIIIEYFGQLLFRRFQELIKGQVIVNPEEPGGQSPVGSSRGNRL